MGKGQPMKRLIMGRIVAAVMVVSAGGALVGQSAWATTGIHNFGGYAAPVTASASATITVPAADTVSCSSPRAATVDIWVGLTRGQYAANAGLNVQCLRGTPLLYVSGAAGTLSFRFPVAGGDVIEVTTSESASGTTVTAADTTTSVSDTANSVGTTTTNAMVVQFGATSTSKPIPNFGPVTLSSVTVDGSPLAGSSATARNLTRSHPPGVVPGPLSSGSFTLTET